MHNLLVRSVLVVRFFPDFFSFVVAFWWPGGMVGHFLSRKCNKHLRKNVFGTNPAPVSHTIWRFVENPQGIHAFGVASAKQPVSLSPFTSVAWIRKVANFQELFWVKPFNFSTESRVRIPCSLLGLRFLEFFFFFFFFLFDVFCWKQKIPTKSYLVFALEILTLQQYCSWGKVCLSVSMHFVFAAWEDKLLPSFIGWQYF